MCFSRETFAATVIKINSENILVSFFYKKEEIKVETPKTRALSAVRLGGVVFLKATKKRGRVVARKIWLAGEVGTEEQRVKEKYRNGRPAIAMT